jgi:hypothetical protein
VHLRVLLHGAVADLPHRPVARYADSQLSHRESLRTSRQPRPVRRGATWRRCGTR